MQERPPAVSTQPPGPELKTASNAKPLKQQKALPSYNVATSSEAAKQWQRLVLTTTSLRNVVLANKSDVIYYEIITPRWARESTTISRLDPNTHQFDIIGEIRNDVHGKASEVSLYGAAPKAVREWLKTEAAKEVEKERVEEVEHRPSEDTESSKKGVLGQGAREIRYVGFPMISSKDLQSCMGGRRRRPSFVGKDGKKYTWKVDQKSLEVRPPAEPHPFPIPSPIVDAISLSYG